MVFGLIRKVKAGLLEGVKLELTFEGLGGIT